MDTFALTDPVLARLPCDCQGTWRPGHFERALPDGYIATLESGNIQVEDAAVEQRIREAWWRSRAPIWSPERWRFLLGGAAPPWPAD